MNEIMMEEVLKVKTVFNDSRENFSNLYNKLHEDFSKRVSDLIERTTLIDEVRNLYEM